MTTGNFRLVYSSVAKHPTGGISDQEILKTSIKNNRKSGVRGVLVRSEVGFTQILEGSNSAVCATFSRISRDSRHHSIKVFSECWSEVVLFPTWEMKYINIPRKALGDIGWGAKNNIASDRLAIATHRLIHANFGIAEISSHFQKMRAAPPLKAGQAHMPHNPKMILR